MIQGVVSLKEHPEAFESAEGADAGVERDRYWHDSRRTARAGGFELHISGVKVVQRVSETEPYPIQLKEHGVDFLSIGGTYGFARRARRPSCASARKPYAPREITWIARATRSQMRPIFTPAACEGTTTLFEVDYIDDQKAYLTQSGQLYVEATAAAFGKVYTFGPTFRAEKSKTRRHLTEFWMLEPEASYAHLEDMMRLGEGLVSAVVQSVVKNRARELATFSATSRSSKKSSPPFPAHHLRRSN